MASNVDLWVSMSLPPLRTRATTSPPLLPVLMKVRTVTERDVLAGSGGVKTNARVGRDGGALDLLGEAGRRHQQSSAHGQGSDNDVTHERLRVSPPVHRCTALDHSPDNPIRTSSPPRPTGRRPRCWRASPARPARRQTPRASPDHYRCAAPWLTRRPLP